MNKSKEKMQKIKMKSSFELLNPFGRSRFAIKNELGNANNMEIRTNFN